MKVFQASAPVADEASDVGVAVRTMAQREAASPAPTGAVTEAAPGIPAGAANGEHPGAAAEPEQVAFPAQTQTRAPARTTARLAARAEVEPGGSGETGESGGRETVLSVRGLNKRFVRADGTAVPAIDEVSFDLHAGEFMVLLGPSGCGKTTLLRSIAGLETPESGTITVEGRPVFRSSARTSVPPERRRLSMVFQSYALWPHMTVFDNVAYPLRSGKRPRPRRAEVAERVERTLATMRLDGLAKQYPNQLSGGQQQRVALCRALIAGSNVVLFDEPLSNVDAKVREQLRIELLMMQRELGFAALFVTHDQQEAMALAHSIAVLDQGRIVQHGTPQEIYALPATQGVAAFVGVANRLGGVVLRSGGGETTVKTPVGELVSSLTSVASGTTEPDAGSDGAPPALCEGDEVTVIWRPEGCVATPVAPDAAGAWHGTVEETLYYGAFSESIVAVGEHRFRIQTPGRDPLAKGLPVRLAIDPGGVMVFPAGSQVDAAQGSAWTAA